MPILSPGNLAVPPPLTETDLDHRHRGSYGERFVPDIWHCSEPKEDR